VDSPTFPVLKLGLQASTSTPLHQTEPMKGTSEKHPVDAPSDSDSMLCRLEADVDLVIPPKREILVYVRWLKNREDTTPWLSTNPSDI